MGFTARKLLSNGGLDWVTNWTTGGVASPPGEVEWIDNVVYGNGKFITTNGNFIGYGTDALTWDIVQLESLQIAQLIGYVADKFFCLERGSGDLLYSYDGLNWIRTSATFGYSAKIAYGNGRFVIVGNKVSYSDDGINWTDALPSGWKALTYGGGRFVIASTYGNRKAYSDDGINWIEVPQSFLDVSWNTAAYGNGLFVLLPKSSEYTQISNIVATSPDGIDWTTRNLPLSDYGNSGFYDALIYADGKFIAGYPNIYSYDGLNWSPFPKNFSNQFYSPNATFTSLAYGNGIIVGRNDYVFWRNALNGGVSSDSPWSAITLPNTKSTIINTPGNVWTSVTYGGDRFVAVGAKFDPVFQDGCAAYSDDGITWTNATIGRVVWNSVAYGGGRFVAVGDNTGSTSASIAAYSDDGITWNNATIDKAYWRSVTYGGGRFFAVSGSNSASIAAYSDDGITWTNATISNQRWSSVTYGGGRFVAIADNSNIVAYSDDGITWTTTTIGTAIWTSVTYGGGRFVAVGQPLGLSAWISDVAAYSDDGITWTTITMPRTSLWKTATYGGGRFYAIAYFSNISAYSDDGITWTLTKMPIAAYWTSVTYGEGRFVAVTAYKSGPLTGAYIDYEGTP